jgi:hypothetical protein
MRKIIAKLGGDCGSSLRFFAPCARKEPFAYTVSGEKSSKRKAMNNESKR